MGVGQADVVGEGGGVVVAAMRLTVLLAGMQAAHDAAYPFRIRRGSLSVCRRGGGLFQQVRRSVASVGDREIPACVVDRLVRRGENALRAVGR